MKIKTILNVFAIRYHLLQKLFSYSKYHVSLIDVLKRLIQLSESGKFIDFGKKQISKIDEYEIYNIAYINSCDKPLYYPKKFPFKSLLATIGELFMSDSWHLYHPVSLPQMQIKSTDIVLDCGSAEGLYALMNKDNCKVMYSIEPLSDFVKAQELTFKDTENVKILACGLSDKIGKAQLIENNVASYLEESLDGDIAVETLDTLFYDQGKQIDVIKADVEGHALKMLQGGSNCLKHYSPKLTIACYHYKDEAQDIMDFVKSVNPNYKFYLKGISNIGTAIMLYAWIK